MINTLKGECRGAHRFAMCIAVFAAPPVWADLAPDASTTRIVREEGNLVIENALQFERDRTVLCLMVVFGAIFALFGMALAVTLVALNEIAVERGQIYF